MRQTIFSVNERHYKYLCIVGGTGPGRTRLQFLTNDASQRVLKPRGLSVQVFPKRSVDEGLIAECASRFFSHAKEAVHNILVEPDGDPGLALGLRLGRKNPAPLALAEIVSIFHPFVWYSRRSWASGRTRGEREGRPQEAAAGYEPAPQTASLSTMCYSEISTCAGSSQRSLRAPNLPLQGSGPRRQLSDARSGEAARRGQAGAASEERVRRRIGTALASAHGVFPAREPGSWSTWIPASCWSPSSGWCPITGRRGAGLFRGSYRSVTAAGRAEREVFPPADGGAGTYARRRLQRLRASGAP